MKKMMLPALVPFAFITLLFANEGGERGFQITVTIKGLKDGCSVSLIQARTRDTLASGIIRQAVVVLRGAMPKGTEYCFLVLDSSLKLKPSQTFLPVNAKQKLNADLAEWPKIELVGSSAHRDYLDLVALWDTWKARMDNDTTVGNLRRSAFKDFVLQRSGSLYIADFVARADDVFSFKDRQEIFQSLSPVAKYSYFGGKLTLALQTEQRRLQVTKESKLQDFSYVDKSGTSHSIYHVISKNKLTLIDFWASWCKPCREQFPKLKQLYALYHNRGLEIIGVALNDEEGDWKAAVQKDELPWLNGRDKDDTAYHLFDLQQIPAYVLVDQEGRLLAFNCKGSSIPSFGPASEMGLEEAIKEILLTKMNTYN